MLADRDRTSGQSSPPARRCDLQDRSSHHDGVIPAHHALLLHREHHVEILSPTGHKCAAPQRRRDLETLIELGHVFLPEKSSLPLACRSRADAVPGQAPLPGSEPAFRTPARLRRVGRNHANPQFLQSPPDLRQPFRIHFPARPGVQKK